MLAEIKQLLELQAIDERIADGKARLARLKRDRARHDQQAEEEQAIFAASKDTLSQMEHQSRMKNLEVDELDMQIRNYQQRLDKGIISFKEMEDLRVKIEYERKRMSTLEDEALSLMDSIESQRTLHQDAGATLQTREGELRHQIDQCLAQVKDTESELAELAATRNETGDAMPQYLRTQYETLHAEMIHPIAELRGDVCTGCKLRVSGNTAQRARGDMGVVTCEHCSRILYAA